MKFYKSQIVMTICVGQNIYNDCSSCGVVSCLCIHPLSFTYSGLGCRGRILITEFPSQADFPLSNHLGRIPEPHQLAFLDVEQFALVEICTNLTAGTKHAAGDLLSMLW